MKYSLHHPNFLSGDSFDHYFVAPYPSRLSSSYYAHKADAFYKNREIYTRLRMMKSLAFLIKFILLPQEILAMSIFNPTKTCVFSEVKARLALNGEPLANVKVTGQWEWHKRKSDEAITDAEGCVTFPAIYESSVTRRLPVEIVIGQRLSVEIKDEAVTFW